MTPFVAYCYSLRDFAAPLLIAVSLAAGCGGQADNGEPDGSGGAAPTKGGRAGLGGAKSTGGRATNGGATTGGGSMTAGGSTAAGGSMTVGGSTQGGAGGCIYDGVPYEIKESFKSLDGCNTCTCYGANSIGCTTIACPDTCSVTRAVYEQALAKAKSCNPASDVSQCTLLVTTLDCACDTFVNRANGDVAKALDELRITYAQNGCGATIDCGICAEPTRGFCNASGQCEDYFATSGVSCLVNGTVYPDGATGIKDPFSCNLCECFNGGLGCTDIGCDTPCPPDTIAGSRCVQCGPAAGCGLVEIGCLPMCVNEGSGGCSVYPGLSCIDGVCQAQCQ